MSPEQLQQMQQDELHKRLWDIANDLRGSMEAGDFKDYILGLIFYKFLSARVCNFVENNLLEHDDITYDEAYQDEDMKEEIYNALRDEFGFFIEPNSLFRTMIKKIRTGEFTIDNLQKALNEVSSSTLGLESNEDFDNLFSDMDLNNNKLGKDVKSRSILISRVMERIDELSFMFEQSKIDVLGDAYEYLIGKFASSAGKKAGEYYTPTQVSTILAKIITTNRKEINKLYDPTCGSGSLLLKVKQEAKKVGHFYGQEKISTTYNLCRMNMFLHGLTYHEFEIKNDDTIKKPHHIEMRFDGIVANPPYSMKWEADKSYETDERFSAYGKLAPKSAADFAFVQHMIYQLDDNGVMAVILPHGVLFRGNAEKTIRKYLIDKGYLDAVIGLPANIFYGTSIPTCILVFKKCKEHDNILFIDASREFEKQKNQNRVTEENINKIISTYANRDEIEKYSHIASIEEIKENDYNLNIPRYVDTFEEEEPIDIQAVEGEIVELKAKKEELTNRIDQMKRKIVKTNE